MGTRTVKVPVPQFVEMKYLTCDDCGCDMVDRGVILTSNPPQFSYICPECGKIVNTYTQYFANAKRSLNGW